MSVLEYTYPAESKRLSIAALTSEFENLMPGLTFEWEQVNRGMPDWSAVTIGHPKQKGIHSLFVVTKNKALNKRDLAARYPRNKNLAAALKVPVLIWSQLKLPKNVSFKVVTSALDLHQKLIGSVNKLGRGVVDIPENEKLYSVAGFQRYVKNRS
jgi:hypothetical protein